MIPDSKILNYAIDGITIYCLILMMISIGNDRTKMKGKKILFADIFVAILLCASDIGYNFINGTVKYTGWNYFLCCLFFILGYVCALLVSFYELYTVGSSKKLRKVIFIVYTSFCVFCSAGTLLLASKGLLFRIENGSYVRGPLWAATILFPTLVLFTDCVILLFCRGSARIRIALAIYSVIPPAGLVLSYYTPGISSASLILLLDSMLVFINIFVEQNREFSGSQIELQESRMNLMLSQIQPHFLYNSLATCASLCHTDPEKAEEAIANFGKYLRGNLDALKESNPVPFMQELKHIRTYVKLEQMRLGDMLTFREDIQTVNFTIPVLTVQPLVENAIKHGIAEAGKKGEVVLSAREDEKNFYINVTDNGQGFSMEDTPDGSKSHIGIENVRSRIETMCGGALIIGSKPNVGTSVTIRIPKKEDRRKKV